MLLSFIISFCSLSDSDNLLFASVYSYIVVICSFNPSVLISKECECSLEELGVDLILREKLTTLFHLGSLGG